MRPLIILGLGFALGAAAERPASANPWSLRFHRDWRGSGVSMGYQLRWGGSQGQAARGAARARLDPFSNLRAIVQSARFELYGVRLSPFRRLEAAPERPAAGRAAAPGEPAGSAPGPGAALDGLQAQAGREMRRFLVRTVFNRALPGASAAPQWQKEAVAADLVDAGRSWIAD